MIIKNWPKFINILTIGIIVYLFSFAFAMALFPIKPFWNDEWRLLYNIKFKTIPQLWGRLDLLQQCPRSYLTLLKEISSYFDYAYTSLRLPPLIMSCCSIGLCFYLKKKIFPNDLIYGNLFILIIIAAPTFVEYLVQVKHYEVDIFLCLLAFVQLMYLLALNARGVQNWWHYTLLCCSFLIVPFFSYVYPIVICPVFIVLFLNIIATRNANGPKTFTHYLILCFPLVLAACSIVVFYLIDIKQLMADNQMYYSYLRMLGNAENNKRYLSDFWYFFALAGSGLLFEIVFGVIGIVVFTYSIYRLYRSKLAQYTTYDYLKCYAILLIVITLGLVLSGKILGGVARLTAFTIPSVSLLIVNFLIDLKDQYHRKKWAIGITAVLFAGQCGNIISTCINTFTDKNYQWRIQTLHQTAAALELARAHKLPIMITDGLRAEHIPGHDGTPGPTPGTIRTNTIDQEQIDGADVLCAEAILKVNPAYKVWYTVTVYLMPDMKWNKLYVQQLPPQYHAAVVCDGLHYSIVSK